MWQSRLRLVIPNWGSCLRIICNLLSKVISSPGGPKLFIWLFDIVFGSWHSSQFPADRHLQRTVATSIPSNVPSIHRSFHRSFVRLFTRWERLFVLSFIQAFNCQATKCKQISSRSSSNNHKSLQPFPAIDLETCNMQHENMTVIVGYPDYTSYTSYTRYPRSMHAPKMSSHSNCRIDLSNEFRFFFYFIFLFGFGSPRTFFLIHSIQLNKFPIVWSARSARQLFYFAPKIGKNNNKKKSTAREKKKRRRNCRELWKK